MGSASSTSHYQSAYQPPPIVSMKSTCKTERLLDTPLGNNRRRHNILQRATTSNADKDFLELMHQEATFESDKSVEKLLRNSIHAFFFLESDNDMVVNLILKALRRETSDADDVIVKEGDEGSKLYILQSGQIEVTIKNEIIRRMEPGTLFGELALLYDAPRSATVKCVSDCIFWSLERDIYQTIQRNTTSATLKQKCKWLTNCPELSNIGSLQMSRLLQVLHKQEAREGDLICSQGDICDHVILVESGRVLVKLPLELDHSKCNIDEILGIIRPPCATTNIQKSSTDCSCFHTLSEGCIIGMHVVKAHNSKISSGKWKYNEGNVTCPVTLVAAEYTQYSLFPIDFLERLLPIGLNDITTPSPSAKNAHAVTTKSPCKYTHFKYTKMRIDRMIGQGGYGTVVLGYYDQDPEPYAVKLMSKSTIVNNGHVQHVADERALLASFSCPFVLKLYGSYQTPDAVGLVTEYLDRGDLWSAIYENPKYEEKYLAPEFIFSNGNDHGVDLWALGVIMHEMYMLKTPFASVQDSTDMQKLFTAIANVKAKGNADLDVKIDVKDKTSYARSLMTHLLAGDPSDRTGYSDYSTRTILDDPFFTKSDVISVENGTYVPRYIPCPRQNNVNEGEVNLSEKFESYSGIQDIFQDF